MALQISIRESGDVTILDLHGRATINDGESELLKSQLQELIAKGVGKFLLNLADLSQVDSSGLSIIAKTCASLRDQGGDLRILRPRGAVLQVLKVLRLPAVIPTFEDENQALASFRPLSKFAKPYATARAKFPSSLRSFCDERLEVEESFHFAVGHVSRGMANRPFDALGKRP